MKRRKAFESAAWNRLEGGLGLPLGKARGGHSSPHAVQRHSCPTSQSQPLGTVQPGKHEGMEAPAPETAPPLGLLPKDLVGHGSALCKYLLFIKFEMKGFQQWQRKVSHRA